MVYNELSSKLARQEDLVKVLHHIFPNTQAHIGSKKQSNIRYPDSGAYLELDVWIPSLNLCFEFQDPYHYVTTWYTQTTLPHVQLADRAKKDMILRHGLTLIEVPCWWSSSIKSLTATIHFNLPDLLRADDGELISLNPPCSYFQQNEVPDVGELMLASFPMDSFILSDQSWWLGEKYDGVRCCWSPSGRVFYTRTGRQISLIPKAAQLVPAAHLDGEFWFGRGQFPATYVLCKGSIEAVSWHVLRLVSFDVASPNLHKMPFEIRYQSLLACLAHDNPFCIPSMRVMVKSLDHMESASSGVIDWGGEGIMLRKIGSLYQAGRNLDLIKLKTSYGDGEGLVLEVAKEEYVLLKLPNGFKIKVPWHNVRPVDLVEGDVISFSYELQSRRELPLHPVIQRKRFDLEWDDIILNFSKEQKFLNTYSQVAQAPASQMPHHSDIESMRDIMVNIAKSFNKNPFIPETWFSIPSAALRRIKSVQSIFQQFKGYFPALRTIFPNIGLEAPNVWRTVASRRNFFEVYAKEGGFEPLIPNNWYEQTRESIMSRQGAKKVLSYYENSIPKALIALFPDIGLEEEKFRKTLPIPRVWHSKEIRRAFFENYARKNGFDPLNPSAWYSHPRDKILSAKGASRAIYYHNDSVAQALIDLFPNIGIEKAKFSHMFFTKNGR